MVFHILNVEQNFHVIPNVTLTDKEGDMVTMLKYYTNVTRKQIPLVLCCFAAVTVMYT